jgi:hypothetical protein
MRIISRSSGRQEQAYVLILTLAFLTISLAILAGIGQWTYGNAALTARNNAYNSAVAAAESATEVAIAQMSRDFVHQSLSTDVTKYSRILPRTFLPFGWPVHYQFSDTYGNPDQSDILCAGWQQKTNLQGEFAGLYGMVNSYQVSSFAKDLAGPYPVSGGVCQSIQLTSIPIYQYAIFYGMDLEINPGAPMVVTGKTHGNADLYLAPSSSLEFRDAVSYVGQVNYSRSTNDPTGGSSTTPAFDGELRRVNSMTLPVGTDNNPTNVVQMLDVPPSGEDPASILGRERFYNKSDMVIDVLTNRVIVLYNNFEDGTSFTVVRTNAPSDGTNSGYSFINTNVSFFDYRETKQVLATELDVVALTNWMADAGFALNVQTQSRQKHAINSIYVNDTRVASGKLTAVRLVNGQNLPSSGLTVSTARPLYVKGSLNAPDLTPGSTNTANIKPASLASDAITILSANWNDSWTAATPLSSRTAANSTVNAAFLAGIVPSVTTNNQAHYSGGVENFPRFLENWSGSTLTYNGSMVVMFQSRFANNFWIAPGTYYNPPTRKWAFNTGFLDPNRLPPITPQVRKLQRVSWNVVTAKTN